MRLAKRLIAAVLATAFAAGTVYGQALPPAAGMAEPKVKPDRRDDGIYHQKWFHEGFLELKEDYVEAEKAGKRFAVIFEQRGCVYCARMHNDVLALKYINDYVRENFVIVQLDLWGAREVTDFDGTKMPEKRIAERWGVLFTPTIVFFKDGLKDTKGWGQPLEVARMQLGFGPPTFYDMFVWIRAKVYEKDRNFQRFHVARSAEREMAKNSSKQP
ncbi:MAG: thioredoxin family protein [Hyphomicrobiaceae bacterium]